MSDLDASFCYDDYTDLDADEAPCVRAPDDGDWSAFDGLPEENEDDVGSVVVTLGDASMRIDDSLIATVQNVCLDTIPKLVDREHVVVPLFMSYGYVRMDPEPPDQLILGDYIEPVRFPRADLIPALVGVGERYLEFLRTVRSNDDDFDVVRERIEASLDAARAALDRWDGE